MATPRYPDAPREYDASWGHELVRTLEHRDQDQDTRRDTWSTAEKNTGEKWIDGRWIFRKVVALTEAFLETNDTDIAHGISSLKDVLSIRAYWDDGGAFHFAPYVASSASVYIKAGATNITSVVVGSPTFNGFTDGYAVIEYTKT